MQGLSINQRLKELIKALDLTAASFSRALGVSETTTRNYTARDSKPGADYLEKIASQFKQVNITWLLTGKGSMLHPAVPESSNSTRSVGRNTGTTSRTSDSGTPDFSSKEDCEKRVEALETENALLRSQLIDKERIIQLLEMQRQQ